MDAKEPLGAKAFELQAPDEVSPQPIATQAGVVVLQLKEKTVPSREEFQKDKANILQSLTEAKANEALVRYVADLRRKAGTALHIDSHFGEETKAEAPAED